MLDTLGGGVPGPCFHRSVMLSRRRKRKLKRAAAGGGEPSQPAEDTSGSAGGAGQAPSGPSGTGRLSRRLISSADLIDGHVRDRAGNLVLPLTSKGTENANYARIRAWMVSKSEASMRVSAPAARKCQLICYRNAG